MPAYSPGRWWPNPRPFGLLYSARDPTRGPRIVLHCLDCRLAHERSRVASLRHVDAPAQGERWSRGQLDRRASGRAPGGVWRRGRFRPRRGAAARGATPRLRNPSARGAGPARTSHARSGGSGGLGLRSGLSRASSAQLAARVEARGLDVDEESAPAGHGWRSKGMVLKGEWAERTGAPGIGAGYAVPDMAGRHEALYGRRRPYPSLRGTPGDSSPRAIVGAWVRLT